MLKEFRCKNCHKLLAKVSDYSEVEIKCNRCKQINYYTTAAREIDVHHAKQRPNVSTDDLYRHYRE